MMHSAALPAEGADERTRALIEHLSRHDAACPLCGYQLRGLASDRCPECNQHLELRVGLAEPRLAAWIVGMVGWSSALGCFLFSVAYYAWIAWRTSPAAVRTTDWVLGAGGLMLMVFALLLWVHVRRGLRRWTPWLQWMSALLCWTVAGLMVVGAIMLS